MSTSNNGFVSSDVMRRIANDDSFRMQLEQNPLNTLASLGIPVTKSDLPSKVSLPASADIQSIGSLSSTTSDAEPTTFKWMGFLG